MSDYYRRNSTASDTGCVGCVAVLFTFFSIVAIIVGIVWYQIYFDQNCLRSHEETYTYYVTYCDAYTRSGHCLFYSTDPEVGTKQVCDQWKEGN